jgi:hypothetical protein
MFGTEQMDLELARQRHAEKIREAALERALAAASLDTSYASGIGAVVALNIVGAAVRGWLRWLTTPRQRPAGIGAK